MLKIINLSTYRFDMDRYENNSENINKFLKNHKVDAIELLAPLGYEEELISKDIIKGVHLKHYPMWLDFWNGDKEGLLEDFNSVEDVINFYGGNSKKDIIDHYKKEIKAAESLNAEYAVFHVSHVKLNHCYSYDFTYTDKNVIDSTIELVNEIFKDLDTNINILFENLWWPGLRMVDCELVKYFIENIEYENKGFMLDTGHLLNTNLNINTEEEGIDFLIDTVNNLGELKEYIKGIHLSKSISSKYVKEQISKFSNTSKKIDVFNEEVYFHVAKIDEHKPFTNKKIKQLLNIINPKYLVYEFITTSLDELSEYINIQDEALGLYKKVFR
ncbi:TIM barrel protein [Romboutsia lituseburensis]|uniref:TIM barrel protein n=1 Tax=Romboutsia lituseburensis TaxID=1537 RepID=UPI0022EB4ADB|nr:TIM barrel protein [Romboutsia lituseburensis]